MIRLLAVHTQAVDRSSHGPGRPPFSPVSARPVHRRASSSAPICATRPRSASCPPPWTDREAAQRRLPRLVRRDRVRSLAQRRLEHARVALKEGDLSIKLVAFRVGYNHVTNFINAFTARYGVPPRAYLDRDG